MPSDRRQPLGGPGGPPRGPGISQDGTEVPPEVDGPPRRTSPRTLILTVVPLFGILVFLVLPSLLASSVPSGAGSGQGSSWNGQFLAVFGVIAMGASMVGWLARTYRVGTDELVIDEGIFSRRRRIVPYGRLQQIDIEQPFFAQLLSLSVLTIETAGSAGGTVKLGMVDVRLARGIRRFALARRAEIHAAAGSKQTAGRGLPTRPGVSSQQPTSVADRTVPPSPGEPPWSEPPPPPPERVLLRLDFARLAIAGATHHLVVVAVPMLLLGGVIFGAFAVPANPGMGPLVVLGTGLAVSLAIGMLFSLVVFGQYVIGQHGYTLSEQGDDLHLRFGLFQVRNVTIPRRRVQHVTISDNPLRRAVGLVGIQLHSAASTTDIQMSSLLGTQAANAGRHSFEIPILARSEMDGFLHDLMGGDWQIPALTGRPPAARRRAVTRRVGILLVAMAVPSLLFMPGSLLLLGVALIGIPWGSVAHRRAGYGEGPQTVVLARGVLHHRVDLLPHARIQSAFAIQSPFQRLSGLRTLHVNVAGAAGDPNLFDMPGETAIAKTRDLPRRSAPSASPDTELAPAGYGAPWEPA